MYEAVSSKQNHFKPVLRNHYQRARNITDRPPGTLLAGNWGSQNSSDDSLPITEGSVSPLNGWVVASNPSLGTAPKAEYRTGATEGSKTGAPSGLSSLDRTGITVTPSWNPEVFKRNTGYPAIAGFNFTDVDYSIPPADVPGMGFVKPGCGDWVRKLQSADQVKDLYHDCGVLSCPRCADAVITRKARDAAERFEHYEQAKLAENTVLIPGEKRHANPRHIPFTLSPAHAAELWLKGGKTHAGFLRLARAELNDILHKVGFIGGEEVYHPDRVRHPETGATGSRAKRLITLEAKLAGKMKDDSPASALYSYIRQRKNAREYYYFSPHFHMVGYGTLPNKNDFDEAFPGWSYQMKGEVKNVGGLLRYLYSHMGMIEGTHAVTWTGRLSAAVLGTEGLRTIEQPVICPDTGLPWKIVDSVIPAEIGRTYTEPVTEYRCFFREKQKRGPPDPFKMKTGRAGPRSSCPDWVREKGVLAMAAYCDEYGRL